MKPEIKIMAVSNVYNRVMHFVNEGDREIGHIHEFDHATLVSSGSVLFEVLDGFYGKVVGSKTVTAPDMVFVAKNKFHRITSLEKNTVCVCIHALRTIDEDLVDPDCFLEPVSDNRGGIINAGVVDKMGKRMKPPAL